MTAKVYGTPGPRSIYPEMCASRSLARCGILANALWPRLIVCCDDQGRMAGDAGDVLVECFGKMLAKVRLRDIATALSELESERMVKRYTIKGESYLQIASWWAWQQYPRRAYPSRMPAPEGWTDYVYGRVTDESKTYREAAGLDPRSGRGARGSDQPDDVEGVPEPPVEQWPAPVDNRTLTAPKPHDAVSDSAHDAPTNRTLTAPKPHDAALTRAQDPVPSRPVLSSLTPIPPQAGAPARAARKAHDTPRVRGTSPRQLRDGSPEIDARALTRVGDLLPARHVVPLPEQIDVETARLEEAYTNDPERWMERTRR